MYTELYRPDRTGDYMKPQTDCVVTGSISYFCCHFYIGMCVGVVRNIITRFNFTLVSML